MTTDATFAAPASEVSRATCSDRFCFSLKLGWMFGFAGGIPSASNPNFAPGFDGATYSLAGLDQPRTGNVTADGLIIENNLPFDRFLRLSVVLRQGEASLTVVWNLHTSYYVPTQVVEASASPTPVELTLEHAQVMLNNLGIYAGLANGVYTEQTRWAISWFQKNRMSGRGWDTRGILDNYTMDALVNLYRTHSFVTEFTPQEESVLASTSFHLRTYHRDAELQREWFPSGGQYGRGNICSIDHDPQIGTDLIPVWGATQITEVDMFPDGVTDSAQAARLFVRDCAEGSAIPDGEYLNTLYLPQPVCWLQNHLEELGFLVAKPKGQRTATAITQFDKFDEWQDIQGWYGRYTEWGVRELQYYAKGASVAHERMPAEETSAADIFYPDRLTQAHTESAERYPADGPVCGSLNQNTTRVIRAWLDRRFRCPVVVFGTRQSGSFTEDTDPNKPVSAGISHRAGGGSRRNVDADFANLWRRNDCASDTHRMFALDYSGQWNLPANGLPQVNGFFLNPGHVVVVGQWPRSGNTLGPQTSPRFNQCLPSAEFSATNLTGVNENTSLFRILKAVAWAECGGYMDSCNAWDDVNFSYPLYHYTILSPAYYATGRTNRELPGFFAYLRANEQNIDNILLTGAGLRAKDDWATLARGNGPTYESTVQFQNRAGDFVQLPSQIPEALITEEAHYFRSWHFYYRWIMASRTMQAMRDRIWLFAQKRLRSLMDKTTQAQAGNRRRYGDYIRSERAWDMLLRWHVYRPGPMEQGVSDIVQNLPAIARLPNDEQDILQKILKKSSDSGSYKHISTQEERNNITIPSQIDKMSQLEWIYFNCVPGVSLSIDSSQTQIAFTDQ